MKMSHILHIISKRSNAINGIMGREFYPENKGSFPAEYDGVQQQINAGTDFLRAILRIQALC